MATRPLSALLCPTRGRETRDAGAESEKVTLVRLCGLHWELWVGSLPCPKLNQLEIFQKSNSIQLFGKKICVLMGRPRLVERKEAGSPGRARRLPEGGQPPGLAANPGTLPAPTVKATCPWASGTFPRWWAHGLPPKKQEIKKATAVKRCPAEKHRRPSVALGRPQVPTFPQDACGVPAGTSTPGGTLSRSGLRL